MADSQLAILYDNLVITVGALGFGASVVVSSKIDSAREQGFRITRTEWFISVLGATTGDQPVQVGYAFGCTAADIDDTMGSDPQGTFNAANVQSNADAKRPVFPMAIFPGLADSVIGAASVMKGVTIPTWSAPEGGFLNWYAFAANGGLTTGRLVNIHAKHFGVWLRD